MSILPRLLHIFEKRGFTVQTGLNPAHLDNNREAPFTTLWRDGGQLTRFGGISLHEVMMLEQICAIADPRRIYVIGNAWGWSTVALALSAPSARVVAVDPGDEGEGLRFTRRIADDERMNIAVLHGASPEITSAAVRESGGNDFNLVLIDGDHQNASMIADFTGVLPYLADNALVVCHDVVQHNLVRGFDELRATHGGTGSFMYLERTASGMAVFAAPGASPDLLSYLNCFRDPIATLG
jgi:predicted O-methyltransferase YrrM